MEQITRIGLDTSKSVFQVHGVDGAERTVVKRRLTRAKMLAFFERLPPCLVVLEACGASHHWARVLRGLGHEVRLIAPQLVKPYVMRGKNDASDAAALCEAASRPRMRFVPVKTPEQQAGLMLAGLRDKLIRRRTQLANGIRGYAAEFGLVAAKGLERIEELLLRTQTEPGVPDLARRLFAGLAQDYAVAQARVSEVEAELQAWHRTSEQSRRLAEMPGIGPVGAALLTMKIPDPAAFRSGRDVAAWLGLTPRNHSTAGRQKLGVITRAGDEALRSVLVAGAMSVIRQAKLGRGQPSVWLLGMLARKPLKLVAVALANKMARAAWRLMRTGQSYDPDRAAGPARPAPTAAHPTPAAAQPA
ncbi:transposase [Methylorubrum rhodinum]|uniref:Transposase n=1 Tax=Methylorubrum rhodinum TaxID=29428 RepID=A0A840ZU91_9HYPH|nr:IS110 family transposase [Methylorubrum rhodinum]MBB5760397.1 transposase [Methylorubrum rhodinum]